MTNIWKRIVYVLIKPVNLTIRLIDYLTLTEMGTYRRKNWYKFSRQLGNRLEIWTYTLLSIGNFDFFSEICGNFPIFFSIILSNFPTKIFSILALAGMATGTTTDYRPVVQWLTFLIRHGNNIIMTHNLWVIVYNLKYSLWYILVNAKNPETAEKELLRELSVYDPDGDTVIPVDSLFEWIEGNYPQMTWLTFGNAL